MQDISLHSDAVGGGDNALHIEFDPDGCSFAPAQSTRSANEGATSKVPGIAVGSRVHTTGNRAATGSWTR